VCSSDLPKTPKPHYVDLRFSWEFVAIIPTDSESNNYKKY